MSLSIENDSGSYSGDFLLDFAIHHIDFARYLFGDVEHVWPTARGLDADDSAYGYGVSLEFECSAVGTMSLTDGRIWDVPTETVEAAIEGENFVTVTNSSRRMELYKTIRDAARTDESSVTYRR